MVTGHDTNVSVTLETYLLKNNKQHGNEHSYTVWRPESEYVHVLAQGIRAFWLK